MQFDDRAHAGRVLASRLSHLAAEKGLLVLGLPRGGVPVAFEAARALNAPLDVLTVRKLGCPGNPEVALGAIAPGGVRVLNGELVESLGMTPRDIDAVSAAEAAELARREAVYRSGRGPLRLEGKVAILVDDGLATGASMLAAVRAARGLRSRRVVVAVPVGASDACAALRREADEVVCALEPEAFFAVGAWYREFAQTTDEEVLDLLRRAEPRLTASGGRHGDA